MVTCIVRVKDEYKDSPTISLQPLHLELYVKGELFGILLADKNNTVLQDFHGQSLTRLISTAISNGRRVGRDISGNPQFYYLGNRS